MIHSIWGGTTPEFLRHIATAAWALGMGTQGYSTSVITWKIWTSGVINSKGGSRGLIAYYKAIIAIVVQSGAIYTALVLPLTVSFATGSSATLVLSDCLDPIAVSSIIWVHLHHCTSLILSHNSGLGPCIYCYSGW